MDDATAKIIVGLIGLLGTILGLIAGYFGRSRKRAVEEAKREQEQADLFNRLFIEMDGIKKRLDEHNHYAEKIGDIEITLTGIRKDIEYLRKGKNG